MTQKEEIWGFSAINDRENSEAKKMNKNFCDLSLSLIQRREESEVFFLFWIELKKTQRKKRTKKKTTKP